MTEKRASSKIDPLYICRLFKKNYGSPRLGNKKNPLDEYLYILLSLRTTYWSFEKVYKHFKRKYPLWQQADRATAREIAATIKRAGLSYQKACHIKKTLRILKKDFSRFSLAPLRQYDDNDAEKYLLKLPGVGLKTAKCIMMYSLGRDVLPVDTHTYRISKRIGLIKGAASQKIAIQLEKLIPVGNRYVYHVGCVVHGRKVCFDKKPNCCECMFLALCRYAKHFIVIMK